MDGRPSGESHCYHWHVTVPRGQPSWKMAPPHCLYLSSFELNAECTCASETAGSRHVGGRVIEMAIGKKGQ